MNTHTHTHTHTGNAKKIILDLCGGTGKWSEPYKLNGYDVKVITMPENNLFEYLEYKDFIKNIYGVLFAPTCTHFSLARTTAKTPRDLKGAMLLVNKGLEIIQEIRTNENSNLKFWAMENPFGYLRQIIGKPQLTFNPMDYGANYSKKTDLWGYYNMPKKTPKKLTDEERELCSINNRRLPILPKGYILPKDFKAQQARRSMTDEHFSKAFYKANK